MLQSGMLLYNVCSGEDSMDSLITRRLLGVTVAIALAACGGSGVPGAATAPQTAQSRAGGVATSSSLSGEYKGTFVDSVRGTMKVTLWLSQYESSLGGPLTTPSSTPADVAWNSSGSSVKGNTVVQSPSGTYCVFADSGTYDSQTRKLTGSYTAAYGCTGEYGTYTLSHKCYYKGTSSDIRRDTLPHPC
ncbi:MAG: hypothetical protein JOZ77_02200 [Candidatus Eremiobacteraeota bacterium]|nr:hypothetical protein [Candidatus Eremiobacteraeota bacterium]